MPSTGQRLQQDCVCPRRRFAPCCAGGDSGCSFAFLFRGADGRDYAATAGHGVLQGDARQLWPGDTGPRVVTPDGRAV